MAERSRRLLLLAGGGSLVGIIALVVIGFLVARAQHRAYAEETLGLLKRAQKGFEAGRLEQTGKVADDVLQRLRTNPSWFEPAEADRIRSDHAFYLSQFLIWNEAEAGIALIGIDPSRARTDLHVALEKAEEGGERSRPVAELIRPHLDKAVAKERERALATLKEQIPIALDRYDAGAWKEFGIAAARIHETLESLPSDSREAVTAEADPSAVFERVEKVRRVEAVRAGDDTPVVLGDRLRDILETLEESDPALRREILDRIEQVEPETRAALPARTLSRAVRRTIAEAFAKAGKLEIVPEPDRKRIVLRGKRHLYRISVFGSEPEIVIEVDRVRLSFSLEQVQDREGAALHAAATLARGLRATGHDRVFVDDPWEVLPNAPGPCAASTDKSRAWLYLGGEVFEGETTDADAEALPTIQEFILRARVLEAGLRDDPVVPDELRGPLAEFVKATHTEAAPHDYLESDFCRLAIDRGYLESHLADLGSDLSRRLQGYRTAYEALTRFRRIVQAESPTRRVLEWRQNYEGETFWRLVDPKTKTTTFTLRPRDSEGSRLVVNNVLPGELETWPETTDPVEVVMVHPGTGEIARWTPSGGLTYDADRWGRAMATEDSARIPEHFGTYGWRTPPHAVIVDSRGQVRALMLPGGTVRATGFSWGTDRREAQEKYLDLCAKAMATPGELNLFFRYLVQYVLDSPVTTAVSLIGSSHHTGDVHQTAPQTLDRRLNGRYLADCDDLAELYQDVLRRQKRPAFVLGVPGHATCGVAEKVGEEWVFFCVDTGPPRQHRGVEFDAVIEKLLRTYDIDGSMSFDPRSVRYLFRFAGEQTREDYYLDSRVLRDPAYADLMIRVQGYWHFGFYALGIETMLEVVEDDLIPANCSELAGLYMVIGDYSGGLKWTESAIKSLDPEQRLSRLSEELRRADCLSELDRKPEALERLKGVAKEISELLEGGGPDAARYFTLQFSTATSLAFSGDPWTGWSMVADQVRVLLISGALPDSFAARITAVYRKMKDEERKGGLTAKQAADLGLLERILKVYYQLVLFKEEDSFLDSVRKYLQLGLFFAAKKGWDQGFEPLLKPEYPTGKRSHWRRQDASPETDWAWIRLSPPIYAQAVAHLLDPERGKPDPEAAVLFIEAMEKALPHIRQHGSLGPVEFAVLSLRLLRACLRMEEKTIRSVFEEGKRQGWGALYQILARTLGEAAPHMKVKDFEKVFRLFCEHEIPRRHYYGAIYEAFRRRAVQQALAASAVCREKFPADADMKREHEALLKLAD